MVFDIARCQFACVHTLEFGEQHGRQLAEYVDQHIEPAAVRHADNGFLHALAAGTLQQVVEQRNQRFAALQREAFLSDIFGMQVALQRLRGCQLLQDMALLFDGI